MKISIMQPYLFPYIGYFQLINAVDKFIFYDDVNFIKNGWINRNRILLNGNSHYITIQLKNASSFKKINNIEFTDNRSKIIKTIQQAYRKAPYYSDVIPMIIDAFNINTTSISEQAITSIIATCEYIGMEVKFERSSCKYSETKELEKSTRLQKICKLNNSNQYFNMLGGQNLYSKEDFLTNGIKLHFINSKEVSYTQFDKIFVPCLSIIDVMMFNTKDKIRNFLNSCTIE